MTLIGLDGLVRASGGANPFPLGSDLSQTRLFEHIRTARSGTLRVGQERSGDNQITSYRILRGFPIAVAVTADLYQPKSSYTRNLPVYLILGCILTVLIVLAILFSLGHSRRLEEARDALGASEAHLREKTRQLELTLTHMSQGIVMVGGDGQIPVVNPRCLELLGLPSNLLPADGSSPSLNYRDVVAMLTKKGEFETEAIAPDILEYIIQSVGSEPVTNYERTRPDGTVLEVRSNALPDGGFVRTFNDITSRRRNEARIAHLARHDPLTDLANRVLFREELDDALVNLGVEGNSFALHLVDLDHFKVVNDSFGHPVGDQLLKAVARRLHEAVRRNDIIARLGGDEFAVLQMQVTNDLQAGHLADRICRIMARPFDIEGHTILVGASIGVALAPGDGTANQDLLKAADLALYSAKAEGRGTYRYFKPEMNITLQARRRLDSELRTAIEQEQFLLHYQPIRDLDADCVTGYEALIRWRHPVRGLVPPLEFIPAAEENGLIVPIGAWALRTALRDIANQPGTPRIAVNLSPIQLRSPDLINVVRDALAESGLPAHRLELEITESALLDRTDVTLQQLKALNDLGVRIALDDFGTGYSSLSYLMSYPIDSIKIDRSFVARLGESTQSTSIVRAITELASNLGMSTTAEGVENAEQLAHLIELGCSEAQGYFFSPPRPAADIFRGPPEVAKRLPVVA